MSDVDILYQISKIKDTEYKNTLFITSLIELLVQKNIITMNEISDFIKKMDSIAATICKEES